MKHRADLPREAGRPELYKRPEETRWYVERAGSGAFAAALVVMGFAGGAGAQQTVKIGAIYPLSGNAASAGNYSKAAIELAVDIINNGNPDLDRTCRSPTAAACPGLGGAKIEVVFADNQGTPAAGQNQALRLITEEKVVALIGAYQSGITVTASAIAERHGIPFLTPNWWPPT